MGRGIIMICIIIIYLLAGLLLGACLSTPPRVIQILVTSQQEIQNKTVLTKPHAPDPALTHGL